MKKLLPMLLTATVMFGCVQLQPGADAFIVRAQQAINSSFVTVDTFLRLEESNRTIAKVMDPQITKIADELRSTYPQANRSAWLLVDTYRSNKTSDNKTSLNTVIAVLEEAAKQAEVNVNKLKTSSTPLQ